jgi:hypothetical protein
MPGGKKIEVDETSETLHTLSSSRQTNKTLCQHAAAVQNKFFNNQQSISVGV